MKRKFINILLSVLILFSNSGWAISFHYCKNTLSSVSLQYLTAIADKETDSCAAMNTCCGDDENQENSHKKCCDNTSVTSSTTLCYSFPYPTLVGSSTILCPNGKKHCYSRFWQKPKLSTPIRTVLPKSILFLIGN